MLLTNHALAGAAIGAVTPNPAAAYTAGVASHFAMDAIPHWGHPRSRRHWWTVAVTDGLTALTVLGVATATAPPGGKLSVAAGVLGACTPDADKPYRELFKREVWPNPVNTLHRSIQRESPRRMPQEFAVAAAGVVAVASLLRRAGR